MLNNSIKVRDLFIALSIVIAVGALVYSYVTRPVIVFVTNNKLYSQFSYTKQLDSDLRKIQTARQGVLDSLSQLSDAHSKAGDAKQAAEDRRYYYELKAKFDEDNENLIAQFNQKIWKQLNQYVIDYGKEHHIDYIMGADGSGAVMYAKEAVDITPEVIDYSNKRFGGTGK